MAEASGTTPPRGDRRGEDRRVSQAGFAGDDRRTGERRSGGDRRGKSRVKLGS